ncbi:hypothetical protein DFH09DRAFT_1394478 [Mycena vulgaris]|nr:hypothetical protein DFH09DRAFT_1394478 [Mycena vulgaris]
MSRRGYHPYFRAPKPLLSGQPSWLIDAFLKQKQNNTDGILATWGHGISNQWDEVPRPQRVTNQGPVDIAATGFKKIWKSTSPFFCPHTKSNGEPYKPQVLCLGGTHEGGIADFFQSKDHPCAFRVVIKSLKEAKYLTSWDDRRLYHEAQQEESSQDDDSSPPASSSQPSISTTPPSSQSSLDSVSTMSSTNSNISRLRVQAMLTPDPRHSPITLDSPPRRPTPIGAGSVLAGRPQTRSFYRLSVAVARKNADVDTMEYLHQIDLSGVLEEDPEAHPAWNTDDVHPLLRLYDQRIYPECLRRTNNYLQFLYKPTGQAIRELNSALGIPYADYATLIRCNMGCVCCGNQFSFDGYNSHISEGRCTNHPDLSDVEPVEPSEVSFRFRSFRDDKRPKDVGETLDTPVGSALLEWNSRLGVPTDVWMVISTAIAHCKACDLVRSFPAHLLHLSEDGECKDPGQEFIAPGPEGEV